MTTNHDQPVLETRRLRLRPLEDADAGLLELYASDARLARMTTSIPHPYPPGGGASFVQAVRRGRIPGRTWAMAHQATGEDEPVGLITLRPDGAVGYWVGAPFQNAGFATEAVAAIIALARAEGFARLSATVFQDNPMSAKVLTKAGFAYLGDGSAHSLARGAEVAMWRYGLDL
jgi:RimJ/RimL family protein N-acetyltransferase